MLEAEIADGSIVVYNSFSLDTADFCNDKSINSLQKLVTYLCAEFVSKSLWAHKILIVSDFLGIETALAQAQVADVPWYKQDVSQLFHRTKQHVDETILKSEINLGKCNVYGEKKSMRFEATIERSLSTTIYNLFAQKGYKVLSIDSTNSAILSWRSFGAENYDENGKVLVCIGENTAKAYWCIGAVPFEEKNWALDESEDISYQIENYIMRDLVSLKLRNPKIIFAGSGLINYDGILAHLQNAELNVLDIRQLIKDGSHFDSSQLILVSCLFKIYNKQNPHLVVKRKVASNEDVIKRYKLFYSISILFVALSLVSLGINSNTYFKQKRTIEKSPRELEVQSTQTTLSDLEEKRQLLQKLETGLPSLIAYACEYPDIFIASIDTKNMLPLTLVGNGAATIADDLLGAAPEGASAKENPIDDNAQVHREDVPLEQSEPQDPVNTSPQNIDSIVLRGYCFSADVVTQLFNDIQNNSNYSSYTLNGIAEIPETNLYAFEIEVSD